MRNLDLSSYLLVPSTSLATRSILIFFTSTNPVFAVQRITRYPLLIKQIIHYTEPDEDRTLTERALRSAERILGDINEAVREQEGRERLREISQDLWLGQGYVSTHSLSLYIQ